MADVFLGRYSSLGFLGQGSMGQVFLAHPFGVPDRKVVVKVMHAHIAADPAVRQSFEREIQSLSRLRHPYIVQLLDSSARDPRGLCLVMEYIPGVTLDVRLTQCARFAVGHVGLLLGYLCHALEAAHSLGIVHRDLKPANLMIVAAGTLDESLRVMDFGLAQFANRPHFSLERLAGGKHSTVQGTPNYMCPEQLRGDEIDSRADLYCVGVMLFEMLTGQLPFQHDEVGRVLRAHLSERPSSFAAIGIRDVAPAVEQIVQQTLSKYAVERPATARELARLYSNAIGLDIWEATQPEGVPEVAEPVPKKVAPVEDRHAIVRHLDAWMPERIAVVKLRGFLEDMGAKVVESEPGLLRIRLGEPEKPERGRAKVRPDAPTDLPVEMELRMEKPDPRDNRLAITVLFRPFTDPWLLQAPNWRKRCEILYKDLQSYLMAR